MKRDTLDNTVIDLDKALGSQPQETQHKVDEEFTSWTPIDMYGLLESISYKLPKGYPTVKDGVFTEINEVLIINEALQAEGLPTLPVPEAKAPQPVIMAPEKVNSIMASTSAYKSIVLPTQVSQPAVERQTRNGIVWRVDLAGKDERVLKIQQLSKSLSRQTIQKLFGRNSNITFGEKSFVLTIGNYQYAWLLKPAPKESKTDTDIKEGLSVILSYYPDYIPTVDSVSIKQECKKIIDFISSEKDAYDAFGISNEVRDNCVAYLKKIIVATDKAVLKDMVSNFNQNNSHANTFDSFFQKNKNYYIDRDKLFESIRKAGAELTGYPKDKWCPGDVYFIRNGSETTIQSTMKEALLLGKDNKEQAIGMLNSLFSDRYYEPADKPIVAVSLKMEDAQAGKLKSGFEEYSSVPTEYSLDSKELTFGVKQYQEGIVRFQQIFAKELKKADVDIEWKSDGTSGFCEVAGIKDLATLKFKYAAYKALHFILTKVAKNQPTNFDDALVSLVAFGLGVIRDSSKFTKGFKVNPPFFKVMASRSGQATKPVLFKPGSAMFIFNVDGSKKPKIRIEDNKGYKGLAVSLGLGVGNDKFDIRIRINSNGNKQVNIELEKARHID